MPTKESLIRACNEIMSDADRDIKNLDGKKVTGELLGTYFGYVYASINALASMIKIIVSEDFELKSENE